MGTIWDRKPFEVIGRCGGDKKTNDHAEPTKVERIIYLTFISWVSVIGYSSDAIATNIQRWISFIIDPSITENGVNVAGLDSSL